MKKIEIEENIRKNEERRENNLTTIKEEIDRIGANKTENVANQMEEREIRQEQIEEIRQEIIMKGMKAVKEHMQIEEKKVEQIEMKIEDIERERRKRNVVIYSMQESTNPEAKERYKQDEEACTKIFSDILEVQQIKILQVVRLGKKNSDRMRPLLVKLETESQKMDILRNAKKLRMSEEHRRVYINKDLTETERMSDRKLREELRERRNGEGNGRFVIRKGKVIRLEQRQDRFNLWEMTGAKAKGSV